MEIFGYKIEKKSTSFWWWFAWLMQSAYEEKPMNFNTFYDMYRISADIKSCIREIQNTVWKSWFKVNQKTKDIAENIFIKTFFQETYKNLNKKPNEIVNLDTWASWNLIKKEFIKHLQISWNLFLLKKRNKIWKLSSVEVIATKDVSIMCNTNLEVIYYIVKKWATVFQVYPDNMFHFVSTYDTKDQVYWISDLSWIIYEAYSDNESSISNYFAMLNNSVPAWLYILKDWVKEAQAKKILDEVKKQVTWSRNRNKSIVSNAIIDFKTMAQTHKDMDFVNMRKYNSEKICSAIWVPKAILSYTEDVNYANWKEQYWKFIENTIRPKEMELNVIMSVILSDILPDVWFECIDNHINDKDIKSTVAERLVKNWFTTRNEARDYLGLELYKNPLMDEITVWNDVRLIEDLDFSITDTWIIPPNNE
jgi:hypothetical protein